MFCIEYDGYIADPTFLLPQDSKLASNLIFFCQVNFAKEFEFRAEESSMEQAEREICRTLR